MTSYEARNVSLPVPTGSQTNFKFASRIPVLVSKSKSNSSASTAHVVTTSTATTATTTTTSCTGGLPATTLVASSPKKSVTLTLLPLPSTRRSSLNSSKKLYGILKNSGGTSRENAPLQNGGDGSERNVSRSPARRNVVCSVPDLIRGVQAKRTDVTDDESYKLVEKWLPCLESIKRDSLSDDTASSVTSCTCPSGEPSSNSSGQEEVRWSSATSGYESDEANCQTKFLNLRAAGPLRTQRHVRSRGIFRPVQSSWMNSTGINFQNVEILTEKEISVLNAKLERVFDVYKKMERNRSVKSSRNESAGEFQASRDKYAHVKAKVQSNAPQFVARQRIVLPPDLPGKNVVARTRQERSAVSKLKPQLKKDSSSHLRLFKNCFSNSEKRRHQSRSSSSIGGGRSDYGDSAIRNRFGVQTNFQVVTKDRPKTFQTGVELVPSSRSPWTVSNGKAKEKPKRSRHRQQRSIEEAEEISSPRPQSPVFRRSQETEPSSVGRMANFKCPRVKQRSSSSVERKLNVAISGWHEERREREPEIRAADEQSTRRSNPVLLNMKLPKRLSKAEVELAKRSSSRSLTGYGHLGGCAFGGNSREVARSRVTSRSVTSASGIGVGQSRHLAGNFSMSYSSLKGYIPNHRDASIFKTTTATAPVIAATTTTTTVTTITATSSSSSIATPTTKKTKTNKHSRIPRMAGRSELNAGVTPDR